MANNETKNEKQGNPGFWIFLWIFFFFVFLVSTGTLIFFHNWWVCLVSVISLTLSLMLLVPLLYWGLAPKNIFFTFVEEGTAKIVVKGKGFNKILIQWEGHTFGKNLNNKWDIIGGEEEHWLGGLRFYGLWPIKNIFKYKLRWTSIRDDGTESRHDDELDSVLLTYFSFHQEIKEAETIAPENIPLTVWFVVIMQPSNPYKAIFMTKDWLELVWGRIRPVFREFIGKHTYIGLVQERQKKSGELWEDIVSSGIPEELEKEFGIRIKEGGIGIKDITPPPEIQKAAEKEKLAEWEQERIAGETMGSLINMIAMSRGKKPKDIKDEIDGNVEFREKLYNEARALIRRKMSIEGKAFFEVPGAGDLENVIIRVMGAFNKISGGGSGGKGGEKGEKPERDKDFAEKERQRARELEKKARGE